jgi:deoxyribodipyrimidine photo-lyase
MVQQPIIVVFYQNLRFHDQPLLTDAIQQGIPVIPLFINDPQLIGRLGGASQWWLYQSLVTFQKEWKTTFDIELVLRTGDTIDVLQQLIQETNASKIYLGKRYTALEVAIDTNIYKTFTAQGLEIKFLNTHLLLSPTTIYNQQNKVFQVFTPFWKACLAKIGKIEVLPSPTQLQKYSKVIPSESLSNWKWGQTQEAWTHKLTKYWHPSESNGLNQLTKFLKNHLEGYSTQRNLIASPAYTSQLSPYLRWGQISVRKIYKEITEAIATNPAIQQDGTNFLSELGWREFSYYLLYHHPLMEKIPLHSQFRNFPWENNALFLQKWHKGMTGHPIIDAGMRQLWEEGWMPNRLRMIVASFLVKDLLIDWQHGMAWFGDTLVDADPANNANSWQWVAGCGADAAPYFRIFNPITQGEKFDPQGKYIKTYVPELKNVPTEYIHQPWKMSVELQKKLGVLIGKGYPAPIVDHAVQRAKALSALQEAKRKNTYL